MSVASETGNGYNFFNFYKFSKFLVFWMLTSIFVLTFAVMTRFRTFIISVLAVLLPAVACAQKGGGADGVKLKTGRWTWTVRPSCPT